MTTLFIDVSSNDHDGGAPIDWPKVAGAGYRGVFIKATQGIDYVNPWLERDAHGARAAGLLVGFYHFADVVGIDAAARAVSESDYFLRSITGLSRELGGCLDLEWQNGWSWSALAVFAKRFLEALKSTEVAPVFYTNGNFLSNLKAFGAPFGARLWYADPGNRPRFEVWAWQKSWTTEVPGVPTDEVDVDVGYF